jgi:hypothetical protein
MFRAEMARDDGQDYTPQKHVGTNNGTNCAAQKVA